MLFFWSISIQTRLTVLPPIFGILCHSSKDVHNSNNNLELTYSHQTSNTWWEGGDWQQISSKLKHSSLFLCRQKFIFSCVCMLAWFQFQTFLNFLSICFYLFIFSSLFSTSKNYNLAGSLFVIPKNMWLSIWLDWCLVTAVVGCIGFVTALVFTADPVPINLNHIVSLSYWKLNQSYFLQKKVFVVVILNSTVHMVYIGYCYGLSREILPSDCVSERNIPIVAVADPYTIKEKLLINQDVAPSR